MTDLPSFRGTERHTALLRLEGRWSGEARTWLDPKGDPEITRIELVASSLLGGRFVRLAYTSSVAGRTHAGEMLVGFHVDAQTHEMVWIDSFHTGSSIMLSTGAPREDGAVEVVGSYRAGQERWGWRTRLSLEREGTREGEGDVFVVHAFNVSPAGQEDRAIEARLSRA